MRTPMWFSGVNAAINIVLALYLFPRMGVVGLGWAFSIASWANALLLGGHLYRQNHFRMQALTVRNIFLIVLAGAIMGAVVYWGQITFVEQLMDSGALMRLGAIMAIITVAALVYFFMVIFTGAIPREQLLRLIRRRNKQA